MDSYEILGVTKDSSNKEIQIAYEDLKRKYDPSFNTSIHAYKKYREILKAYENIKDEQRRKMYDLKDDNKIDERIKVEYDLYDFEIKNDEEIDKIDYDKVSDYIVKEYKNIEIKKDVSYLYKLLNLRYELDYFHKVKCADCKEFNICPICAGEKVVEYKEHLVWCPVCSGSGKVSINCPKCGDSGFCLVEDKVSFYIDDEIQEFKGLGDEYGNNLKSDLRVLFNFYDKDNIKVTENVIEVTYYMSKEETKSGINKQYFSELGAFKLEIPSFVEDGYKHIIDFNNKRIVFTFYNEVYNGEDEIMYLFINKCFKDKYIYFSDDYKVCSEEENVNCQIMLKCEFQIVVKDEGKPGKYGGSNGNLIINVTFSNSDELLYTDNVKVLQTSKMFNMLGGKVENIYHYGFKGVNSLIKRKNYYYLLNGESKKKNKLKDYFVFRIVSLLLWFLVPILIVFMPYKEITFITVICILFCYFILINILMEVEV